MNDALLKDAPPVDEVCVAVAPEWLVDVTVVVPELVAEPVPVLVLEVTEASVVVESLPPSPYSLA